MNAAALRVMALMLLYAVHLPVDASSPASREWRFEVFLDDKPIGFHHFHLNSSGDTHELRGEARFLVKLLGFTVYEYDHQSHELWQQDCLQRIDASTDNNGTDLYVRGSRDGSQLLLKNNTGNSGIEGCVMTFAYWNPAILMQQRLLNTQTGEYLDVSVQRLGEKTLQVEERTVPAMHYRLSSAEGDIELWYSTDDDWLALSSTTSGGRELHYRRVAAPVEPGSSHGE